MSETVYIAMAEGLRLKKLAQNTEETSHRRVRSNTYKIHSPREDLSHHRTLSGSGRVSKPLFQDKAPLSGSHRGLSTEASSPPTSPPLTQHKPGRGFLGTLDAAILYFETVQHVPLTSSHSLDEATHLRQELDTALARVKALEKTAALLASENSNYQRQREAYERHIGALNTRILDLQMALDECRARLQEESVDLLL